MTYSFHTKDRFEYNAYIQYAYSKMLRTILFICSFVSLRQDLLISNKPTISRFDKQTDLSIFLAKSFSLSNIIGYS